MPTTLALPSGDKIQLADDQDEDEALSAVMGYAESEAERLNASAGPFKSSLSRRNRSWKSSPARRTCS